MAPKKPTEIKRANDFDNASNLSLAELEAISTDRLENISAILLTNLNWNGGAIGILSLALSADNQNVVSGNLILLGSLFLEKTFNTTSFWNVTPPATLCLSIPDLSVFSFSDGNLYSDYTPSAALDYSFKRGNVTLTREDASSSGLSDFCVRAFVYPIAVNFARILILLFPYTENVLAENPLYQDPRFPGIKCCDFDIPLAPSGPDSPLERSWGFPLVPAIFPGSSWSADSLLPSGMVLRAALTSILRSAVLPETKLNLSTFQRRLEELNTAGGFSNPSKLPLLIWPSLPTENSFPPPPLGMYLFL